MTTLPPPKTAFFSQDSLEKQVYALVEKYKEFIPIMNDRYRLSFSLFKYLTDEGDEPLISVKAAKLKLIGLSEKELAAKLSDDLKKINEQ